MFAIGEFYETTEHKQMKNIMRLLIYESYIITFSMSRGLYCAVVKRDAKYSVWETSVWKTWRHTGIKRFEPDEMGEH